jgi:hypothetical protein
VALLILSLTLFPLKLFPSPNQKRRWAEWLAVALDAYSHHPRHYLIHFSVDVDWTTSQVLLQNGMRSAASTAYSGKDPYSCSSEAINMRHCHLPCLLSHLATEHSPYEVPLFKVNAAVATGDTRGVRC